MAYPRAPFAVAASLATIGWLIVCTPSDPSIALLVIVHAAIFAVFGLVAHFDEYNIGKLFMLCFSTLILVRTEDALVRFFLIGLVACIGRECDRISAPLTIALYAAMCVPFDVADAPFSAKSIAVTSHRAFLCATGGSRSATTVSGFVLGQFLLFFDYSLHHDLFTLVHALPNVWHEARATAQYKPTSGALPLLGCQNG